MIEKFIQQFFNKPSFKLSKDVPLSYIIYLINSYISKFTRGLFRRYGFCKVGKNLMLGSNVKFRVKSKMTFGNNIRIGNHVIIDALSEEGIIFKDGVKLGDNTKIIVTGSLSDLGKGLYIGENTSFSENTFFGSAGGIKIGSDVIGGQNVRFHAENHNFNDPSTLIREQGVTRKGIEIGNNVWIGAGAVFLDGAKVADGCVIGANSVIKGEFKKNAILAGIPAKVIRYREKC